MADAIALTAQSQPVLALVRQAGVLVGLAAAVALGIYVAMWSRSPEFVVLYNDLSERDLSQVVDALNTNQTAYRIDHRTGVVLVAADQVHEVRMRLAASGLPRSAGMGFELLAEDQGFGASQFLEQARYQRAVEEELSRSISRITNVQSARVHVAIPKRSAFARTRREPTASVILNLFNGRRLEPHQVGAIVHLVSASVPGMSPDHVTVVDQRGALLSDGHGSADELAVSAKRFEYVRRLEQSYIDRVEAILMPLVGPDGVRAQVTAEVDFTSVEQTRESYEPDDSAVRSESVVEERRRGRDGEGVPGALSNEPPAEATVAEADEADETGRAVEDNRRSQTTRNYELDRTIAHTKQAVGEIKRLSVAVIVRNPVREDGAAAPDSAGEGEESATASQGFDDAALARMDKLVREAVGFSEERGDTVSVTNADFLAPEAPEALPEPPLWEQPWLWSVVKQVLGGIFALVVLFGVIRPTIKGLLSKSNQVVAPGGDVNLLPAGGADGASGGETPNGTAVPALAGSQAPSEQLLLTAQVDPNVDQVRQFVAQDPKVAAQVIKGWVGDAA